MNKKLDSDKIREKLSAFLDKYYQIAPTVWAARMDLSRIAVFKFLNGTTNPQKKTLGIINAFIDNFESDMSEKRRDPSRCEVCRNRPKETYYEDWGDGVPHWVCFEHMKNNLEKK